ELKLNVTTREIEKSQGETPMPDFTLPDKNTASPFADLRGHHVAIRTPSLKEAKDFYIGKLDFRVVAEWDYGDAKLAYLAPPADDRFFIEVLGGGAALIAQDRAYTDLGDSLKYRGYHHFCLNVVNVEETVAKLRARGISIAAAPFVLPAISRKL